MGSQFYSRLNMQQVLPTNEVRCFLFHTQKTWVHAEKRGLEIHNSQPFHIVRYRLRIFYILCMVSFVALSNMAIHKIIINAISTTGKLNIALTPAITIAVAGITALLAR